MVPSDPVLDFRLPRFSDKGYSQWVLRGGKGIYDGPEQIRVEKMSLHVYSGDERMALEMTIDSPDAMFLLQENRAVSESPIEIVGSNFKVSGVGWAWDGTNKEIEVKSDVVVEFSQEVVGMLSGKALETAGDDRLTKITSNSLALTTTPEVYRFRFADSVRVVSGDTTLESELLVAIADAPQGEESKENPMAELELDSIDKIIATEEVVISQAGHVLEAGEATFSLREQNAEFTGNPRIKTSGAHLSGSFIRSEKGKLIVTGSEASGRAQMTVYQAGGLGISKDIALSQETVALADVIRMQEFETENQFSFEGSAEVMSGSMLMRTDNLTLYLDPTVDEETDSSQSAASESEEAAGSDFNPGEVVRVTGEGSVYIEQDAQVATCDQVVFYPKEEHAVLSGNPKITHDQAIITGETMELKQGFAIVNGSADQLAQVVLPELPDMGSENLQLMDGIKIEKPGDVEETENAATEEEDVVESETIISAKTLRMIENPDHFLIKFNDTVLVEGTNLRALCNRMEVTLVDQKGSLEGESQMQVQSINAYEDVVFEQSGRMATADKAIINPADGKIVLEGNAVLTDDQGKVTGHRITFNKGEGRAIVESDGAEGSRARITLPEMEFPDIE